MAKFYQPDDVNGLYYPGANEFSVDVGCVCRIGFKAKNKQEEEEVTVGLSSSNALKATYQIKPLVREYEISTDAPTSYTLRATREGTGGLGVDVIPPLKILVRFRNYWTIAAEGQNDPSACWMACLSWWLTATEGRTLNSEVDILGLKGGNKVWLKDGTISAQGFITLVGLHKSLFMMKVKEIRPSKLKDHMGRFPMIIGFKHPGGFGHMNVLYAYNAKNDRVTAMDSWWPDFPVSDPYKDGGYFDVPGNPSPQMTGKHETRDINYYYSTLKSGKLLIGYPQEYSKRMP